MEKVNAAKNVIKMGTCPGNDSVQYRKWGGIYDAYMLLSVDGWVNSALPDGVRPSALKAAYDRREGRVTKL